MNMEKLLGQVDIERIYQHVLNLEKVRHPLSAPQNLEAAADYIYAELEGYGVPARKQPFVVEGFDHTFHNVEGWVGDVDEPAAALMNHFDTEKHTPGANDNAAGVAVTLECARILAKEADAPPVRFLSFNLEEGNPAEQAKVEQSARGLGLLDDQGRYTSYQAGKLIEEHSDLSYSIYDMGRAGRSFSEAVAEATARMADRVPSTLFEHFEYLEMVHEGVTAFPGQNVHLGAWAWMDEALRLGKRLKFGICLDEIGRVHKEEGCQSLPETLTWDMLQIYKVDQERRTGDWAFIITGGEAGNLGQAYCGHCQDGEIDLPYAYLDIPMDYETAAREMPQTMGSDFTAFWHAGIPWLFLFDTAGWRKPSRGHTMADTIDRLDFDQIARVCKATLATLVDPALRD